MDFVAQETQLYRTSIISYVYRLTGSLEEAQDITQETMIKYVNIASNEIENPKAWMFKVATNLAWDFLKSARMRYQSYKGPFLPEPFVNEAYALSDEIELDESLSMALWVLMQKLSTKEKIAYILHDIFDFSHHEIANIMDVSVANSRKISSRANQKLHSDRVKFSPTKEDHELLVNSFLLAIKTGDFDGLQSIFSAEISFISDGGGKARAAQKIIHGNRAVALFVHKTIAKSLLEKDEFLSVEYFYFNGSLGLLVKYHNHVITALNFTTYKNKIHTICVLRNPDKLLF